MKIKKTLARITLACIFFSLISAIAPNAAGLTGSTSSISTQPFSPLSIDGSAFSIDVTLSSVENRTDVVSPFNSTSFKPFSTPRELIQNADGSVTPVFGTDYQNHWFLIDFWTSWPFYPMPPKMNGTFVAVANTINGLAEEDIVMYLPLNVAYGPSHDNCRWFQFEVRFLSRNRIEVSIWNYRTGVGFGRNLIGIPYIEGHRYNFELAPVDDYHVEFSFYDIAYPGSVYENLFEVPSTNMLNDGTYFSPASAVEGWTTNEQLTNVPYFQTYVGYDIPAHFYQTSGSFPSGVGTKVWWAGDYYYWAMLHNCYMTSATGTTYGDGWVYNPTGLVGSSPDYNWAFIWGPSYGSGGNIAGSMNTVAGGNVYVYGCSGYECTSDLLVFASYDYQNWYQIGETITVTWSSPEWISIGTSLSCFKFIAVVGYNTGNPVALYLDAVKVGF